MIKFFGQPLKEIKSKTSGKFMFRFDTKGEFITDDPEIIKRATGFFDYLPLKAEPDGERIKTDFVEPVMTITNKNDKHITPKQYKCKKCDFQTDNRGELMAHYKTHKKGK